ncbi:two-component response regulator-like APRR1 isoform X2 [Cannabis sativa]|uniref:two-component response regulator-like APRR1 isoform X2 n=1 Tax=Cannabis sativa TaxID=3483 RepID=UPI0029CA6D7C|nr:two-component response regulator-like APRR1 isoform X2 [Cannabis sativa]
MCNKSSPLKPPRTRIRTRTRRTRSHLQNDVVQRRPLKSSVPARRSRTKTRRPKYLSLRLQLSKENQNENDVVLLTPSPSSEITEMTSSHHYHHHQLNLFPLHPENLVNDATADDNVALLFDSDGGAGSLNGLLPTATPAMSEEEEDSSSQAAERRRFDREYNYLSDDEDHHNHHHHKFFHVDGRDRRGNNSSNDSLVRTAMRNRERDLSEEKWVSYSEVVEEVTSSSCSTEILEKKKLIETTSSSSKQGYNSNYSSRSTNNKNLALKLDYQEILKAWSDKGSLYIQGDSPQTVPDLQDNNNNHGLGDVWGNLWQVPENEVSKVVKMMKEEGEGKDNHSWINKMGQREASVLRYKEKRQSRLFAKRIRYEVRKLNAEKRPRMKGRFVKIS